MRTVKITADETAKYPVGDQRTNLATDEDLVFGFAKLHENHLDLIEHHVAILCEPSK